MKFSNVLGLFALGVSSVSAAPAEDRAALELTHLEAQTNQLEARANLPGLNSVQSKYARAIIAKAKSTGVGAHGCQAGIATALVESSIIMYANKAVPSSLKYHHDRIGSDHDSIGIFQQRASIYKNIKCDMDAGCSAGQFFTEMKRVKGWKTMAVGTLCQRVQRSAYPDRYAKQVRTATKICKDSLKYIALFLTSLTLTVSLHLHGGDDLTVCQTTSLLLS